MEIIDYINQYVHDVTQIDSFFKTSYQVTDVLRAVKTKIIPKESNIKLTETGDYYFHGIGCRIIFPSKDINYDYSPRGVCGGFSVYDIRDYLKSQGLGINNEEIIKEFRRLDQAGVIFKSELLPNRSLYYLMDYKRVLL